MKKHFALVLSLFFIISLRTIQLAAQTKTPSAEVSYVLSMSQPQTHYFEVEMKVSGLKNQQLLKQGFLDFKMPVWTPGSYLIREYAKNVEGFEASASGKVLLSQKINKNTWRVQHNGNGTISVKYKVYAYELSVRTSFLDESHGYLNGASMFLYVDALKSEPLTLTVVPYKDWKMVSTGLPTSTKGNFTFEAPNYDILVDSPIEIGNQKVLTFTALGVPHYVAMYGEANYDESKVVAEMKKVVETAASVVGEHPCKDYTFIVHNIQRGGGGLEHLNSTTLQVSRNTYTSPLGLNQFLSLVAHEYFHLWNVKRIRPKALGPFDYENENYTHLLWVSEGFTTFYQTYILRKAGILTPEVYLNRFTSEIAGIENTPGQRVQSVAESSWDAWIKYYRQNENSKNSLISYYDKGSVIGALLNLAILAETNGQKNLDDVMRYLWNEYYKKQGRGFTDEEMQKAVETVAGKSLNDFFQKYIWGTDVIDYNAFLKPVGCQLTAKQNSQEGFLGADSRVTEGRLLITSVFRDSPAYNDGLNVNDEIVAVNDSPITPKVDALNQLAKTLKPGDAFKVSLIRDGLKKEISVTLKSNPNRTFAIERLPNLTPEQESLYKKWLYLQ
ncbi:MAG: PDZ domain-containing protein [Spirosomataceae bacterium]